LSHKKSKSFTVEYGGRVSEPKCHVQVGAAIKNRSSDEGLEVYTAIWDTGATGCVISERVVESLGLSPISATMVHHVGGSEMRPIYLVDIRLPNGVGLPQISVTSSQGLSSCDLLIGMSVITAGDFAITTHNGITRMSFRFPSVRPICFVNEWNEQFDGKKSITAVKQGRNSKCSCGSGKKYKHCCGRA
jgi:predicted aspartyl protease